MRHWENMSWILVVRRHCCSVVCAYMEERWRRDDDNNSNECKPYDTDIRLPYKCCMEVEEVEEKRLTRRRHTGNSARNIRIESQLTHMTYTVFSSSHRNTSKIWKMGKFHFDLFGVLPIFTPVKHAPISIGFNAYTHTHITHSHAHMLDMLAFNTLILNRQNS